MSKVERVLKEVKDNGFDCAIAIATNAEVEAKAACGMMSLVNEVSSQEFTELNDELLNRFNDS